MTNIENYWVHTVHSEILASKAYRQMRPCGQIGPLQTPREPSVPQKRSFNELKPNQNYNVLE